MQQKVQCLFLRFPVYTEHFVWQTIQVTEAILYQKGSNNVQPFHQTNSISVIIINYILSIPNWQVSK